MSEPAAKRPTMDFDEFERRLRVSEPAPHNGGYDPLAELARLVDGNKDPYADVFGRQAPRANLPGLRAVEPDHHDHAPEQPVAEAPQDVPPVELPGASDWQIRREEWPPTFQQQQQQTAPAIQAPAEQAPYAEYESEPAEAPAPKKSNKAFYLMAASLALVAVGVGATVLGRGGSNTSQDAPIIKAAQGPMKVQPEQPAAAEPSRTASVLDKSGDKLGASKVVNREEQPIDIAAAKTVKPPQPAPAPGAAPNFFPEPRRVRTIPVRPDGSLMGDAGTAAEPPKPVTPVASTPAPAPAPRPTNTAITPAQLPKIAMPAAQSPTQATPAAPVKTTTRVAPPDTTASTRPAARASRPLRGWQAGGSALAGGRAGGGGGRQE